MATYSSIMYTETPSAATTSSRFGLGSMKLIKDLSISSGTGTVSFVNGSASVVIDSTYKTYIFKCINLHPSADNSERHIGFQASTNAGSSYGISATQSFVQNGHGETSGSTSTAYDQYYDQAASTGFIALNKDVGADNDQASNAELWLFNPSNTSYMKQFICRANSSERADSSNNPWVGGYFHTTSAIDAIQFKMTADDVDAGNIKLYGIA